MSNNLFGNHVNEDDPESMNQKYKKKYQQLKKRVKQLVLENAAICDQVAHIQEQILCVKEERRFLLKKLFEVDPTAISSGDLLPTQNSITSNNESLLVNPLPPKKATKKRSNSEASAKSRMSNGPKAPKQPKTAPKPQPESNVQTISVDSTGRLIDPLVLGSLTIHNFGDIVNTVGYHSSNWIYPVGFVSTRIYAHPRELSRKSIYTCKILEGEDGPRFEIIPDQDAEFLIAGPTPDLCHAALLQTINNSSDSRKLEMRPHGELFFGLGHQVIMSVFQGMPEINGCSQFVGFDWDSNQSDGENDPTLNYDALQRYLSMSVYVCVPEIKEEPPDELLEQSNDATSYHSVP